MEEKRYFCLECLGYDFYMSSVTLKDGFEAWLHMCENAKSGWSIADLTTSRFLEICDFYA
jgi:hypothetical protein